MNMPSPDIPGNRQLSVIEGTADSSAVAMEAPASAELFRQMFVSLDLPEDVGPVIGFTSAIAGEGKTSVALGMARTLAADLDTMILLVDLNFERPGLHSEFNLPIDPGLAGVLRGETSLEEVMCEVSDTLFIVPSGNLQDDGSRLLRQFSDADLFMNVREQGVVTILDLPPILNNSYSAVAALVVDALVLVVRAGATPAEVVGEALSRSKVMPQGVVLNGQQTARPPWRLRRRHR